MNDPVNGPAHYRGASGMQSIEITHAYRLGPDLTQAVDYILRAGRKTLDPRQDLAKAAFYLRYAARHKIDLAFGPPRAQLADGTPRPSPRDVSSDFGLCLRRAVALGYILRPFVHHTDCTAAADEIDLLLTELDDERSDRESPCEDVNRQRQESVPRYGESGEHVMEAAE